MSLDGTTLYSLSSGGGDIFICKLDITSLVSYVWARYAIDITDGFYPSGYAYDSEYIYVATINAISKDYFMYLKFKLADGTNEYTYRLSNSTGLKLELFPLSLPVRFDSQYP